jgi:cell division protein FtsX
MPNVSTDRKVVGYITLGLGTILILVGIGLIIYQFQFIVTHPMPTFPERGASIGPSGASAHTTYVGVIVLIIGAFLALIGAGLAARTPK